MTDTELNQLRQNLTAQFRQMMSEELPPDPEAPGGVARALEWASRF